mgnify:CR=1 FL=1
MSCASCAISVESTAKSQAGIYDARVNLATHTVQLDYDDAKVLQLLQKSLEALGYELDLTAEDALAAAEENQKTYYRQLKFQFTGALLLSLPVMVIAMFFMDLTYGNWLMLVLSTPVVFWFGRHFFKNAWGLLKHGQANMDTLVALSTGIAWIFSLFNTLYPAYWHDQNLHAHVYYESAAVIITFILLGRLLEEKAKNSTASALRKLMGLQPSTVLRLEAGQPVRRDLKEIESGDRLLIRAGDQIPVDGKILAGTAFIDEAMLSGEPIPVSKTVGDMVFAGTINRDGRLELLTTGTGKTTLLAQIIRRVQEAQGSKAAVQQLVDRIASHFVPLVILLAMISFNAWLYWGGENAFSHALLALVTVLVIACPCALGLATPTAIMVGMGKGASQGILIRDADSLEKAVKITDIVLDKTGTLTTGQPSLEEIVWRKAEKDQQATWLAILLALEEASDHPLAKSISSHLRDNGILPIDLDDFRNLPGKGVLGTFAADSWLVGSSQWMVEMGIPVSKSLQEAATQFETNGYTTVWMAHGNEALAVLALSDQLKPSAASSIQKLRRRGLKLHMLTGDHSAAAQQIAAKAGIINIVSGVLPAQKADYIRSLQAQGKIVAMVGDGINDSEALATADLSIAMGSGSDIAIDVAGMTLLHNDLSRIETAIRLSKATVATIRQNLFWAFIYNLIGIPLAAGALYAYNGFLLDPMLAAAAMALSSVSVVANSLRLQWTKIA